MLARWSTRALFALALVSVPFGCGAPFTTSDTTSSSTIGTGGTGGTVTSPTSSSSSTGGTGGTVTSPTSSSTGGAGGTGGMPECTTPDQCPGVDSECRTRTCEGGKCGFSTPMALAASQVWGDCKARGCDGQGNLLIGNDAMDVYNDANECTLDTCDGSDPNNKPKPGILCSNGMGVCNEAGVCVQCSTNDNCPPLQKNCQAGHCVPLHCVDGIQDMGEPAKDCGGGDCAPCPDGAPCSVAGDCLSDVCQGQPKICKPVNCNDGVMNGSETDVDCGAKCAAQGLRCNDGKKCKAPDDCASQVCKVGVCQPPTCTDGLKNGNETGMDCGGDCKACFPD